MTIDTARITTHRFWCDAPMLCDALVRDEELPVEDDRLLGSGVLASIRGGLGRSAARRRSLRLLEALFRNQPTSLDLVWTPVKVVLEDEQTNVLLLAHTGRVVWFNGFEHFDVPGVTVWSAGYLSDGGWLWSDLNRIEHIRDATMGSHGFMKGVLKPGRLSDAETILRAA
jgi:hypothetical protein